MINFNRLYYFHTIAESKSVTKAAKLLKISQPSLSQQMKIFEQELDRKLFIKNGRNFVLTSHGQEIYEHSLDMIQRLDKVEKFLSQPNTKYQFTHKIGISDEIERPFIAELISKNKTSKMDNAQFFVVSKTHDEVLESFLHKEVDLIITNKKITSHKAFMTFELPVYLVTSKTQDQFQHVNHANIKNIINQLGQKLVVPTREMKLRSEISKFLGNAEMKANDIIFETNILACIIRGIREGLGVGFVPLPYIMSEAQNNSVRLIGPKGGYWKHVIYLYKSDRADENLIQSLVKTMKIYLQ